MKSLKVLIISEHGNMESCSLLKKINLEEFIEDNIPELEEDEDKKKNQKNHLASVITHLVHEAYELGFHPKIVHPVF